jgi:putative membrane protein
MKKMLCVTATLLLASGAAFAADQPGHKSPKPGQNTEAMSAVEDATAGLVGRISAEMTSTTNGFVTAAAISDMYEVAAGKIAAERGSPAVKAFGEMMVKAHTETTSKLKATLASNKINAKPPAAVDNRRQGMLDNLRGASKADFDNRYITQQVAAHKEALALMTGYAKDGDAKPVRDFAAETAKHVRMHLAEAEKLAKAHDKH